MKLMQYLDMRLQEGLHDRDDGPDELVILPQRVLQVVVVSLKPILLSHGEQGCIFVKEHEGPR